MTEVEQVCDRVGVIRAGQLVAEGTVDELRGRAALRVRAEPLADAERVAAGPAGGRARLGRRRPAAHRGRPGAAPAINRALVGAGIAVSELVAERASLEEVFLELTQGEKEEA